MGILTADNRKVWCATRLELLKDATNKHNLECIESSLFVLCLDDFIIPKTATKNGYRNSIQLAKMDLSYMSSMLLHGGGSNLYTANRWFDKFFQLIVSKEGICGVLVEHSASEGVTVMRFLESFLKFFHESFKNLNRQNSIEMQQNASTLVTKPLTWNVNEDVKKRIKQSEDTVDK